MNKKVFITKMIPLPGIKLLENSGFDVKINPHDRDLDTKEIMENSHDCQALITMLSNSIDNELIKNIPGLKCIANYAVGYNNIDTSAASAAGIAVFNLPGVLARATAELTFALLLAAARKIIEAHKLCSQNLFKGWSPMLMLGSGLYKKRLGIIGMGEIGTETARIAHHGFNMEICYYNRGRVSPAIEKEVSTKRINFEDLIKSSDFICIHTSLNSSSRHLFTIEEFKKMKKTAVIVNAARGPVICEQDLVLALQQNLIAAAGLDVFEFEPEIHPGLLNLDNVVLAPHIGSATTETRENMSLMAAQSIIDFFNGKLPDNTVNPESVNTMHP